MSKTTTAGIQSVERQAAHEAPRTHYGLHHHAPRPQKTLPRHQPLGHRRVRRNHEPGFAQRSAGGTRVRHQPRRRHQAASPHRGGRARVARRHRPHDGRLHRPVVSSAPSLIVSRTPALQPAFSGVGRAGHGDCPHSASALANKLSSATGGDASKLCTKSTPSAVSQLL